MDPIRQQFVVSQKAVFIRDDKALIMEIAKRPGVWDIPGGRIDEGENIENSFKRELKEELGFDNFEILGVVDHDAWYMDDRAVSVVFRLIKNDHDEIKMSPEHIDMKWISKNELDNFVYYRPTITKMIKSGFRLYNLLNKK